MVDVLCFHLLKLGNMDLKSPGFMACCKKETLDIQTLPTFKGSSSKEKNTRSPEDTLFGDCIGLEYDKVYFSF
jgi:hypothetical protein